MDPITISNFIQAVGFPITMVCGLAVYIHYRDKQFFGLIKTQMEDNQKTNEKLLETNSKFATEITTLNNRMDNMEDDISDLGVKVDKILDRK